MKSIINKIKEYIQYIKNLYKDANNKQSKTHKYSLYMLKANFSALAIGIIIITFLMIIPSIIKDIIISPNFSNALVAILEVAFSAGSFLLVTYELGDSIQKAETCERDNIIDEIKNNKIKLKPVLKKTILYLSEQLKKDNSYTMKDVLAITKEQSEVTLSPGFFNELYKILKESKEFSEKELVEIFATYYGYNYKTFHNHQKNKKNKLENYDNHYAKMQEAKQFISEEGELLPNKVAYNENFYRIITCDNYFEIPDELFSSIIYLCNVNYIEQNSFMARKHEVAILIKSMTMPNYHPTIKDHEKLQEMMKQLKYPEDKIKKINKAIENRQRENQSFIQAQKENDAAVKKEQSFIILRQFLDLENNEPLKYISEQELETIKIALETLKSFGFYNNDKIKTILTNISKNNEKIVNKEQTIRFEEKKNELFKQIDCTNEKPLTIKASEIYQNAIAILSDETLDATLNFAKDKINILIEYVNDYIHSLLDQPLVLENILEIKDALKEIDQVFEDIYTINPSLRTRVKPLKESN